MDVGSIMGALAAGKASLDLVKAAAEVRDFNAVLVATTEANQRVLDAQQQLYQLSAELLRLQEDHFRAREELRDLKAARGKKDAYRLAEIGGKGALVYESVANDPKHYACQPCLDKDDVVSVLQPSGASLRCTVCKQAFRLRDEEPLRFTRG